jgi:hypothetical protein
MNFSSHEKAQFCNRVVLVSTFNIKRLPGILDQIRTESTKYAQIDRERAATIESIRRLQIKANALESERNDVKANLAVSSQPSPPPLNFIVFQCAWQVTLL